MAGEFELDLSKLSELIKRSPEAAAIGAKRGLHDSLDDWKREAVDIAPLDKGTLRRGINNEGVEGSGLNLSGEISSVAVEKSKSGRFNYAYCIHELDAGGKELRHPGTEKKYLDKSAKSNKNKWMKWIQEEIEDELKRKGW